MKKIGTLLLVILISFSVYSQDRTFRFGLKAAPSVAWLKAETDGYEAAGSRIGFSYGILGDFNFSDNYALATGLEINYNGGKLEYADVYKKNDSLSFIGTTNSNYQLQYVQLPITMKMKTNEIGYMTYFAQFGLGAGVNIGAKADNQFSEPGAAETIEVEKEIEDQIGLFRASLIIGLGAEYNISGNTNAFFGVSFNNGFTNIFTKNAPVYQLTDKGEIAVDSNTGEPIELSTKRKAISNYIALNLGVFF